MVNKVTKIYKVKWCKEFIERNMSRTSMYQGYVNLGFDNNIYVYSHFGTKSIRINLVQKAIEQCKEKLILLDLFSNMPEWIVVKYDCSILGDTVFFDAKNFELRMNIDLTERKMFFIKKRSWLETLLVGKREINRQNYEYYLKQKNYG